MALITCQECGATVSTAARVCPNCGAGKRMMIGQGRLGCWRWAGIALLALFAFSAVVGIVLSGSNSGSDEQTAARSSSSSSPYLSQTLRDVRLLKQSMRDPDSIVFETIGTNHARHLVCIVYRARNGFGGMNREAIAFTDAGVITSPARMRRLCHGSGFEDVTRFVTDMMQD